MTMDYWVIPVGLVRPLVDRWIARFETPEAAYRSLESGTGLKADTWRRRLSDSVSVGRKGWWAYEYVRRADVDELLTAMDATDLWHSELADWEHRPPDALSYRSTTEPWNPGSGRGDVVVTTERKRTADGETVHQFLCRLPTVLDDRLRDASYNQRRPKAEIVRDALGAYLSSDQSYRSHLTDSEWHQFLCRIPLNLHEQLRQAAFDQRRPKSQIVRDALDAYLS